MPGGRPKSAAETGPVKSVAKVLDLLEHIGAAKAPASVSDIARATGFNVSTAFRLLQTLAARGYVEQHSEDRSYALGPRIFQLGSAYLQGSDLVGLVRPHLEALRDALGETTYLTIYRQGENILLCKADGQHVVSASARVVEREPSYCTASGKVLLSGLAPDELSKYAAGVRLEARTPQTIRSKTRLLREVGAVRRQGYALDMEEFAQDLCCVSVPLRHPGDGTVRAAISVAMPKMRFKRADVGWWVSQLQARSTLVSQQLGFVAL
jgi:DNA-binding IclR family transcriptional regulator